MKAFLGQLYEAARAEARRPLDRETFERTGSRLEFEAVYFARRKFLSAAALFYLTGGGERSLESAEEGIRRILSEPTWVHPAHGERIDLFAAETGFLLAELCTLLPLSQAMRADILGRLREDIVLPFGRERFGWEESRGNWLAVCMGNVAGTLFYADPAAFETQRDRLKGGMLRYLEGFPEDGWCAEGLEYWNFGFGAFVRCSELLFPELLSLPKARAAARYPWRCFLKGNVTASFSDCPMHGRADRGLAASLAARYGFPLLTEEETCLRAENCAWLPLSRTVMGGARCAAEREREDGVFGTVSVLHKTNYSLAVKAGDNGEEHNHNDVGSFILSADGGQILADLGQPRYDRDYFSPKRYGSLAASSLGHSVPIVGGRGQGVGKKFRGTLSPDGRTVDFAGAYEGCGKLVRTFFPEENGVRLRDEFDGTDEIVERFVFLTDPAAAPVTVVSGEGLSPRVAASSFFAHDGKKREVWFMDFDIPRGSRSAEFGFFLK